MAHIELALHNVEPAPPSTAPVMGGSAAYPRRVVLTPEEIAASDATARAALRTWRLQAAPAVFEDVRRRIASAGLAVDACAVTVNDSFTDDEIDAIFRQVKAFGARTLSSPLTLATARRLVPFAERHDVAVSIHHQIDGNAAGLIDLPRVAQALALSPRFRLRLDVGRITASNRDAVETARELLPRASCVILTDHLRNGGASQPLGEGDTPLAGVLQMLAAADPSMPVLLEYDYRGLRPSAEEVKTALAYLTSLRPRG